VNAERISPVRMIVTALGALVATAVASAIWGGLLATNLSTTPTVPWSAPVTWLLLWLAWRYAGGRGLPASTQASRRAGLRGHAIDRARFVLALVAGGSALLALTVDRAVSDRRHAGEPRAGFRAVSARRRVGHRIPAPRRGGVRSSVKTPERGRSPLRFDRLRQHAAVAQQLERERRTDAVRTEVPVQRVDVRRRLIVDRDDHVVFA